MDRFKPIVMLAALGRSPALRVAVMFGVAGLGFSVANILLARYMSLRDYAVVALSVSLINLGYPVAPLGLEGVVVRRALAATPQLLSHGIKTSAITALGTAVIGATVYGLEPAVLVGIFVAVLGGGVAIVASAKFQSMERFPISVALAQGSNFFVLVAAIAVVMLGLQEPTLAVSIVAVGHLVGAVWGWQRLFASHRSDSSPRTSYPFGEALALAGANGATVLMLQLERLMIPKVLDLEQLASFGVVAAIVIAPFRILQMGVMRTLLPRLRNEPDVRRRRQLLFREAMVVAVVVVVAVALVWAVAPTFVEWFFKGKYRLSNGLLLAAVIAGGLRVISGFTNAAVTALVSIRRLTAWNVLGWAFTGLAVAAGAVGAAWGLPGVIYGVALGWLGRIVAAAALATTGLRNPAHTAP